MELIHPLGQSALNQLSVMSLNRCGRFPDRRATVKLLSHIILWRLHSASERPHSELLSDMIARARRRSRGRCIELIKLDMQDYN